MTSLSHAAHCKDLLSQAQAALETGRRADAERYSSEAWAGAAIVGDKHLRARSELTLAQVDVLESRFEHARMRSARAASVFQETGDHVLLPLAREVQSYANVSVGRPAEALHMANAGLAIREKNHSPRLLAQGLNYLGVTQSWSGDLVPALATLEAAVWYAQESETPASQLHPLLNMGLTRLMAFPAVALPDAYSAEVQEFRELLTRMHRVSEQAAYQKVTLHDGVAPVANVFLQFLTASGLSLAGDCETATAHLVNCNMWLMQLPRNSWLHALGWWAQAIWALRRRDLPRALHCATEMEHAALAGGHVPLQNAAQLMQRELKSEA